jgi:energy-coupling factor transporter ATP-binding protein EcfA2
MHLDPAQALFGGRSRLPLSLQLRLSILFVGFFSIVLTGSDAVSGTVAVLSLILMVVEQVARIRFVLPLLLLVNLSLLAVLWSLLGLPFQNVLSPFLRAFACAGLLSWFGGTVSWNYLKHRYLGSGKPKEAANFIDYGILHGEILINQVLQRFDAAFARVGSKYRNPSVVAAAVAGGIGSAFERASTLEEARRIRQGNRVAAVTQSESFDEVQSETAFIVENIGVKVENGVSLLTGFNFSLRTGEWLLVAGPSGSGKTTLLRAILGLQKLSSGEIRFGSGQKSRWRVANPDVGLIFQNPDDQFFASTPREDVIWGLTSRGVDHGKACLRAEEVLSELGVGGLADQPISKLSFGEKKRVAIAGVLAVSPKILLCDEPTSGLDPVASRRLIATLEAVTKNHGTTVVWVSHDLHLVPESVTKILLLRDGKQICFDTPRVALAQINLIQAGLAIAAGVPDAF